MMRRFVFVSLVVVVAAVAACKKDGESWSSVVKKHAPAIDALRDRVVKASAELDKNLDAKSYAKCERSADYKYAPLGTASEHNIDYVDEPRLVVAGLQGFHASKTVGFNFLSDPSTLTYAFLWIKDGHGYGDRPTKKDIARLEAAEGVKTVVLFRERADSDIKAIKMDAFVVDLEPVAVKCAISIEADGQSVTVEGTPVEHWVETTYNRETNVVLGVREFTTGGGGGTHTSSAAGLAHQGFEDLSMLQLGFTPKLCEDDDSWCSLWYEDSSCVKGACLPDQAKIDARKASYARSVPIFEATRAIHDECERLAEEVKGATDRSPFNSCIDRLWAAMEAEGTKLGVAKEEFGEHRETWVKQQVPLTLDGKLTCDELVPTAIRDKHGLEFLSEEAKLPDGMRALCAFSSKTTAYNGVVVGCATEHVTAEASFEYWRGNLKKPKPLAAGKQGLIGEYLSDQTFVIVDDDTPCYITAAAVADTEAFAKDLAAALTPLALSTK